MDALLSSANFTLSLLPVRLAHRIKALWHLPYMIVANPNITKIYDNYINSLSTLLSHDFKCITRLDKEKEFTHALMNLVETHSSTIPVLAQGFLECRKYINSNEMSKFLNEHLRARIGTRLIAEQHISLHYSSQPYQNFDLDNKYRGLTGSYIGILDSALSLSSVINSCGSFVSDICETTYGQRPSVIIDGDSSVTLAFVPIHLEYIMIELLKNAFRATVENGKYNEPITITIAAVPSPSGRFSKPEDLSPQNDYCSKHIKNLAREVTIRIRDRGGGISPEVLPHIWSYSFTTFADNKSVAGNANLDTFNANLDAWTRASSIAGLGYGLPLARAYAEYFGGSIAIQSLHGWGCDVYLHLKGLYQE